MSLLAKSVLLRFIKSGLAGAFSTAGTVTYLVGITTWTQLGTSLSALSLSLTIGFITGIIMAGEKYFNWVDTPIQ